MRKKLRLPTKAIVTKSLLLLFSISLISLILGRWLYGVSSINLSDFLLVHFIGYLFFILMPVELAFAYFIKNFPEPLFLIFLTVLTAIAAQSIDYIIGRAFSTHIINSIIGEKRHKKIEHYINEYGGITIFFFNLLPLSSPIVALVAGMLRYSYKKLFVYMVLGLCIKYIVITLIV